MKNGNPVITIEIKDKQGRVVATKEVVTYAGVLSRAHHEGLKKIVTKLIQTPSPDNEMTAISMARVETDKGVFVDYGDASPGNVIAKIAPHIIRMSVTRAKARAMRDAVNIGIVSLEELAEEFNNGNGSGRRSGRGSGSNDSQKPMTNSQERYLFRLLSDKGMNDEEAHEYLIKAVEIESLNEISKKVASDMIDHLRAEASIPKENMVS